MFKLEIQTDNAAFDPSPEFEVTALLRIVADRVEAMEDSGNIIDANGSKVGTFRLDPSN